MGDTEYYSRINELLSLQKPFVSVIMVDADGSIPQEVGTKMLVTADGLYSGTVGGGKVEKRAIEEAQALLSSNEKKTTHFVNWSLNRDIGMTCGGQVKLYFETHNATVWTLVVFGAGHIANALMQSLIKLECRIICIDPRQQWLDQLPDSPKLTKILEEDMPSRVASLPDFSFVMLMTMGHSTDKPILLEIFRQQKKFPYLGVIGSAAKAARLRKDISDAGLPAGLANTYHCPMGLDLGNNHPQEIAISIAAQLLQVRDRYMSTASIEEPAAACAKQQPASGAAEQ